MRILLIILLLIGFTTLNAQTTFRKDTVAHGKATVLYDNRLDELIKKEAAYNELLANSTRAGRGYRLMVMSSNDQAQIMKVRSLLLQKFPGQKVYMSFQPPYIKLRFGNFTDKQEAEHYRNEILKQKLVNNNVYVVPDTIEVKPDKNKEKENREKDKEKDKE